MGVRHLYREVADGVCSFNEYAFEMQHRRHSNCKTGARIDSPIIRRFPRKCMNSGHLSRERKRWIVFFRSIPKAIGNRALTIDERTSGFATAGFAPFRSICQKPPHFATKAFEIFIDEESVGRRRQNDLTLADDQHVTAGLLGQERRRVDVERRTENEEEI